jgi:hypothetical protein
MRSLLAVFGGALLAAGIGIGAFAHPPDASGQGGHKESDESKQVTIQGELIDAACFMTSDGDAKGKEHAECAHKCMASGVPAAILPEGSKDSDAAMYLLTNPTVLAPYAAQTIKVEGKAYEDKHAIACRSYTSRMEATGKKSRSRTSTTRWAAWGWMA